MNSPSQKEEPISLTGDVSNVQNGIITVDVKFGDATKTIMCTPSGKMRKNSIMIIRGDLVEIEVSPYSLERGRVVRRLKR